MIRNETALLGLLDMQTKEQVITETNIGEYLPSIHFSLMHESRQI